ncbi:MAG TPA: ABC transporter permease [Candidatus Angelobacter sp.]|nr:ABC transporter permease [Candidatus Angelobacter sp.]
MESFTQDVRFALRSLLKSPRFTATALVTLTLGIAATVAIFTFVDAALIRPLPYRDSSRLFQVYETRHMEVFTQFEASYPDFLDWRAQNQVFDSLAGYQQDGVVMHGIGSPQLVPAAVVTDNFFNALGVVPVQGRDFRPGEDLRAAPRYALISYAWWQRQFGGRPEAVGRTLELDDAATTIIGVLPEDFHFAPVGDPDVWLTTHAEKDALVRRNMHWLNVVGRLKPGVSKDTAAAAMNVVAERLEQQYPQSNHELRTAVVPLSEVIVGKIRPILLLLLSAVVLLLLIACANVANLLLARSVSRTREMAVRTALGASRSRLMALMLTEGLVLSFTGALFGLFASYALVKGFVAMIPEPFLNNVPYLKHLGINSNVVLFAVVVAVVTGMVFSLAPAVRASRGDIQGALKEGTRSSATGGWRRFASSLVVAEVAVALVLLAGSGLLIKSLYRLLEVDPGFDQSNLLVLGVALPDSHYKEPAQQVAVHRALLDRVRSLPGVLAVGSSSQLPISNGGSTNNVRIAGQPTVAEGREANRRVVDQYYFQTLRAQLLNGRWFSDEDNASAPQRVIVNKTFADHFMNGLDPLKQQVVLTFSPTQKPRQVIGIVRDVKEGPLDIPSRPAIYFPMDAEPGTYFNLAIRTGQKPQALIGEVKAVIREVDADAVTIEVQTMDDRIQRSPAAFLHRYPAWLAGAFAVLALVMGSIGLYGLVAYSVSQRTQEIGIRMALGAQRGNVLKMILAEGVRLIIPGAVIGTAFGAGGAYLMRSMLFGVTVWDPVIFGLVTALLAAVTMLASFIPAHQAMKVDPMVALRYE